MNPLSEKEQRTVAACIFAARGDLTGLRSAVADGLDAGITVNEFKELFVQLYAYCGFPRSLNAIGTLMTVVGERRNSGIQDEQGRGPSPLPNAKSIEFGTANQTQLCGGPVQGPLFDFAPAIDEFLKAHLFGDIFARDNLDWKTRELATIAMLAAMSGVEPQRTAHIAIGKRNGLTDEQIEAVLAMAQIKNESSAVHGSFPKGQENTAFAPYFSGKSFLAPLTNHQELNVPLYNVTFEPGCRNNWHTHTGGQILIAVDGTGYYQERGKAARRLTTGDVVEIAPNIEHWHGAAPDSWFSHLAIECHPESNKSTWLEPVSDDGYRSATSAPEPALKEKVNRVQNNKQQKFAYSEQERKYMDNYITPLKDDVKRTAVHYQNRFGIELSGDLYTAKDFDETASHPGIVIGAPYGGVKEQGPCVYAEELARRGFVVLTFDPSFYGYSGGSPRHVSSPEIYTEDFCAGVDFLGTRTFVDREKIGTIGICGSGGFSLSAAQIDPRIKAAVTVSMYDMSRCIRQGFADSMTKEQRDEMLKQVAYQRWSDFESGRPALDARSMQLAALTDDNADPIAREFAEFYVQPRGYHHNALAQHTMSSLPAFANYSLLEHVEDISPRPILLIVGENAHSRYFSEDVYRQAADPKELYIVPDANHVDLYDRTDKIPFDKITRFFTDYLK